MKISFGKYYGKHTFINNPDSISILLTDPRFLSISVCHGPLLFSVTSAHAPYNITNSSSDHVEVWWDNFMKQYKHTFDSFSNRICGIDTNQKQGPTNPPDVRYDSIFGPVGSVVSAHCNFNCFLDFCSSFKEAPINTHKAFCDCRFISNPYSYIHKHS